MDLALISSSPLYSGSYCYYRSVYFLCRIRNILRSTDLGRFSSVDVALESVIFAG